MVGQWRARWPGAAGREIEVRVELQRGENLVVCGAGAPVLRGVREHALVEVVAAGAPRPPDGVLPIAENVRVVERVGGVLTLAGDSGPELVPADRLAFQLRLTVTVAWGTHLDRYPDLAVHPDHPRSVLRVFDLREPAGAACPVWLRRLPTPGGPVTALATLLLGLVHQVGPTRLDVGGDDGGAVSSADLLGEPAATTPGSCSGSDPLPAEPLGSAPRSDDRVAPAGGPPAGGPPAGVAPAGGASGLAALAGIGEVAIVAMPDMVRLAGDQQVSAVRGLIRHCEARQRYRVAVVDPPRRSSVAETRALRARFDSAHAALYHPWVETIDPTAGSVPGTPAATVALPPSGFVAGIYARNDLERGVHRAPASEVIRGITGFDPGAGRDSDRERLRNPDGVNTLRYFTGRSSRVWGARTLSSDPDWRYLSVRRLFLFLAHSIDRSTRWAVGLRETEWLWAALRRPVEDFLFLQWRTGALQGIRPEEAYFVRCDRDSIGGTTPASDAPSPGSENAGDPRSICLVGVALVYPAEFLTFRVGE